MFHRRLLRLPFPQPYRAIQPTWSDGLGFVLPAIVAGIKAIGAVAALAFSPLALVIAALAAGAYYIYSHWDKVGPYFEGIWNTVKTAAKDAWSTITNLALSAWETMTSFATGGGEIFGFTLDESKAAAVELYTNALEKLRTAWDALQDFGKDFAAGFGDSFSTFFGSLAETGKSIEPIANSFGRLGTSLSGLVNAIAGLDQKENPRAFGDLLGTLAGKSLDAAAKTLELLANSLKLVVDTLTAVSNQLQGKPVDWEVLRTDVFEVFKSAGEWINSLLAPLKDLLGLDLQIDWSGLIGDLEPIVNKIIAAINTVISGYNRLLSLVGASTIPTLEPFSLKPTGGKPANDNLKVPGADASKKMQDAAGAKNPKGSLDGLLGPRAALVKPPKQDVDVGGQITVTVVGPGKVTGAASSNPKVAVVPDRGKAVGKV